MPLNRLIDLSSIMPNWGSAITNLPQAFYNPTLAPQNVLPSLASNYITYSNNDVFDWGSSSDDAVHPAGNRFRPFIKSAVGAQSYQPPLQKTPMDRAEEAYRRNNFVQAVSLYGQAIDQDPSNITAYNKRGVARAALHDNAGAIADYTMAIALAPNFYNAYLNRGNLWVYANDSRRALADYGKAIEIDPTKRSAYENRSELYSSMGRHDLSLADRAVVIRLQQARNIRQRPLPAVYPQRIALVLANDDYPGQANDLHGGPLYDAQGISQQLRLSGFSVMTGFNLTGPQTKDRVNQFVEALQKNPGAASLIYYSGHGGSINGNNYLIPVNYNGQNTQQVLQNTVSVDYLLQQLKKAHSAFNMIFLDACRTPMGDAMQQSGGSTFFRSAIPQPSLLGEGPGQKPFSTNAAFKKWETEPGPPLPNTWIEYASRPDTAALQEDGQGLYTKYLLKYMAQPGLNLEEVSMYTNYALEQDPDAIAQNQHARTQTDLSHTERLAESFYFKPSVVNPYIRPNRTLAS